MKLLSIFILSIFLFGCNPTKQAAKHLTKAFKKDANYVAQVTRDSFPCTDLLISDTATVIKDSVIYIDCPDYENGQSKTDTIIKVVNGKETKIYLPSKTVKVPVKLKTETKYITKWFEDSAKIKLAYKEVTEIKKKLTKVERSADRKQTVIWCLLGLLAAAGAFIYILIRRSK